MADLMDFRPQWHRLCDKAHRHGLQSLSPEETVWYLAELLQCDIQNGGLISHYYNSGADNMLQTLKVLDTLGMSELKQLLENYNALFPGDALTSCRARNEIISSWPDDDSMEKLTDPWEADAQVEAEKLESQLVEYIVQSGLA